MTCKSCGLEKRDLRHIARTIKVEIGSFLLAMHNAQRYKTFDSAAGGGLTFTVKYRNKGDRKGRVEIRLNQPTDLGTAMLVGVPGVMSYDIRFLDYRKRKVAEWKKVSGTRLRHLFAVGMGKLIG